MQHTDFNEEENKLEIVKDATQIKILTVSMSNGSI